jgi:hypothetical protein
MLAKTLSLAVIVAMTAASAALAQALPQASPSDTQPGSDLTAKPVPAVPTAVTVKAAPGKGVMVTSDDGRFSMNVFARFVAQDALAIDSKVTNEATIRTTRLTFKGQMLSPQTRYLMQFAFGPNEFETSSPSPLFDAWLEHEFHRDLSLRVGQYFVPFDRGRTNLESKLQVVDRAPMIGELTLDRDTGFSLQSNDLFGMNGLLSYNLSLFGGKGRNRAVNDAPALLTVGRFAVHPFGAFDEDSEGDIGRLPNPRLMVGVAGAYNKNTNRTRGTTGNALAFGTIDYGHLASDLVFKYRGFSLLAEVAYRKGLQDSFDGTVDGKTVTVWSRSGWGYVLQAGMMLTDKLEATGRWSQLLAISPTDPDLEKTVKERGCEVGGGLNYYLNGHLCKIQSGYAYQFGEAGQGRHSLKTLLDVTF